MATQRFLIAPLSSGLVTNPDPWLIMDDAWARLQNVHSFRGKVIKRIGAQEMDTSQNYAVRQQFTRLRILIGTTDGSGDIFPAIVIPGVVKDRAGQMFSVGDEMYTVTELSSFGAPADMVSTGFGIPVYYTNGGNKGEFTLTGGPALTNLYFYPSDPVMALPFYQNVNINAEQLVAFDTQFAYQYTVGTGWDLLGPVPPAANSGLWSGEDSDFHWTSNWRGVTGSEYLLFVVNGVVADQIQYWDGANWNKYSPIYTSLSASNYVIRTAKIVMPFKNRLLLMNTTEQTLTGDMQFVNRLRYSLIGDPTNATTSFDEELPGRGSIDITTREQIISAQYLKDRLIVFCESSTWELVYTGNNVLPFRFQQINIELGVESQNSLVTFDKQIIGFGSTGVHQCNGMNVQRIDDQIPDTIFSILNQNAGPQRVNAIRDYFSEEVYWSFTESDFGTKYPNQILVYNYKTGSWSINFDSITAMGYYQANNSVTWADMTSAWSDGDEQWGDPSDIAFFRSIVAGNQQGFTFIMTHDQSTNSLSLSITNVDVTNNIITITCIDHNLTVGDWINIDNIVGMAGINSSTVNYQVNTVTDSNTLGIVISGVTGTYRGAGTISRVSEIYMKSKQYNFFNTIGKRMHIPRIDFMVDVQGDYTPIAPLNTSAIKLDFLTSFSTTDFIVQGGAVTGANVGTYALSFAPQSTQEASQEKLWRATFPLLEGDVCQLILFNDVIQMSDVSQTNRAFRLHAMLFHVRAISDFGY